MKLFRMGLVARVLNDHDTRAISRVKEVKKIVGVEAETGVLPPVMFAPGFTI
jgi:hypothetical protein